MIDRQNTAFRVLFRLLKGSLPYSAAVFLVEKVGCNGVPSNEPAYILHGFAACLTSICGGVLAYPLDTGAPVCFHACPQPWKKFLNNCTRQFAFVTTKYPMNPLDKGKRSGSSVHFVANPANIRRDDNKRRCRSWFKGVAG